MSDADQSSCAHVQCVLRRLTCWDDCWRWLLLARDGTRTVSKQTCGQAVSSKLALPPHPHRQ